MKIVALKKRFLYGILTLKLLWAIQTSFALGPMSESYKFEGQFKYELAIQSLTQQKKIIKGFYYHLRLGWLYYLHKKYKNSLKHYQKAKELSPQSITATLGLSNAHFMLGQRGKALSINKSLVEVHALNEDVLRAYLNRLMVLKKYEVAQDVLQKTLVYYPEKVPFLEKLLAVELALNHKEEAKSVAHKILVISPNHIQSLNALNGKN